MREFRTRSRLPKMADEVQTNHWVRLAAPRPPELLMQPQRVSDRVFGARLGGGLASRRDQHPPRRA